MKDSIILLFEIPKELKPKLPPLEQIRKDDSNHGISEEWCKVCVNVFKTGEGLFNLPRIIWVKKSWTLKEVHYHFF